MTSMFSKPKMPDTSAQEKRLAEQDAKLLEQEKQAELQKQSRSKARGAGARRSILLADANPTAIREVVG